MAIGNSLYTTNDQLDASGYYDKIKPQYDELVQKKLDEINKASGVDIEENKKKVEEIKKIKHALASYKTVKTVCIVFLVLSSLGSIAAFISAALAFTPILYAVAVPLLGLAIFLICVLASKKRKSSRDDNQNRLNQLLDECTKQMAKLVNSIDSFIFPNIIEKVYSPFDFERMMKINNE
jgi:Flp pilus assembly protein TadB